MGGYSAPSGVFWVSGGLMRTKIVMLTALVLIIGMIPLNASAMESRKVSFEKMVGHLSGGSVSGPTDVIPIGVKDTTLTTGQDLVANVPNEFNHQYPLLIERPLDRQPCPIK